MTKSSASRGATHVAVDSATRGISDLFDASIDSDFVDVVAITGALIGIAGAVASLGVLDKLLFGLSPFDVVNLA